MADLYTRITEQPDEVLDAMAKAMETRTNEPAMQDICARYMGPLASAGNSRVLEIGCGNGATTKLLLKHLKPSELVGIDPSPRFIEMAENAIHSDIHVSFQVGDALRTGQPDASFDIAIAHTVFSHLPDPEGALAEAYRVLKPGGSLVVFDGDYATVTVSLFDGDPLQAAAGTAIRNLVHDPYIMRRLPALASKAGFALASVDAHGYVQTSPADYLQGFIARSADAAVVAGEFGEALSDGFKQEVKKRVQDGTFYGAIMFLSIVVEKPPTE